jgi:hypothetical protein
MGSENAHGCTQNAGNGFNFEFFEGYHKGGDEFLSHIVQVTGDEIWVSFVNVEAKEQSAVKAVDAHAFTKQAKTFRQTSAYQKADDNCFLGQERSTDGGIHATRDHKNVRSVLQKLKDCTGPFRTKGMEC